MTCGDNKQFSNSKIHRKIAKQDQSEHEPLKKIDVRSITMKE